MSKSKKQTAAPAEPKFAPTPGTLPPPGKFDPLLPDTPSHDLRERPGWLAFSIVLLVAWWVFLAWLAIRG